MIDRREFIRIASVTAVAAALGSRTVSARAEPQPAPAAAPLRVGVIGVGLRGRDLIRAFTRGGAAQVVALCDVNPARFKIGAFMARTKTLDFEDHRQLLAQVKLDAVVIATPHAFHAEQAIAALEAGCHVYCEPPLAHTVELCGRLAAAATKAARIVQVGHQYRYADWVGLAMEQIKEGNIGVPRHVEAHFDRNNDGLLLGADGKPLPRAVNWRLHREFSAGPLGDLGSHQLDLANRVFGATPESVTAAGGVDFWKDGRDVPDNMSALFRYPGGRTLSFVHMTTNSLDGVQTRIYGTEGGLVVTNADANLYYEPKSDHSAHAQRPSGADVSTGATRRNDAPYRGPSEPLTDPDAEVVNPDPAACAAFVDSVRTGSRPLADLAAGLASAEWAARANLALAEGRVVRGGE